MNQINKYDSLFKAVDVPMTHESDVSENEEDLIQMESPRALPTNPTPEKRSKS